MRFRLTMHQKNSWTGRLFIMPWVIGFILFFARPIVQSILYTFHRLRLSVDGFEKTYVGLQNYIYAFTEDPDFVRNVTESFGNMLYEVPIIIMFSLFVAMLLNQKFRGRSLARAVFFLPVIISSGIIIEILRADIFAQAITSQETTYLFQTVSVQDVLVQAGLSLQIVEFFTEIVNRIFDLSWKAGVQILLFLAGLQSIPPALYEVSAIEGATAWESFWKITFPMVSPIILVNIIYSVIDSFTDYGNKVMRMVAEASSQMNFHYSATMVWIYFVIICVAVGLIAAILSKRIFYIEG